MITAMSAFQCFACSRVIPLFDESMQKKAQEGECPSCGAFKGQLISKNRLVEGMDAGVFYNVGPDGKLIKKK